MKSISLAATIRYNLGVNVFQLAGYLQGDEAFDNTEVTGPFKLITMEAIVQANEWYERYTYPLVYEGYPLLGWMKVGRANPYELGVPPIKDIYIQNARDKKMLEKNNVPASPPFTNEYLAYNLGESVAADFRDLQRHAVNYIADDPSRITPRLERLIMKGLPSIRYGPYGVKVLYTIPGVNRSNASYELEIFNRIPDND
jgi:hypothetical protein